jgi:hypothetical protein
MSDLYDADIALWSVHQAELLRRMAKGERVNDHWRAEARGHRDDAREAYAPSMKIRPELDVSKLYRRALRRMPDTIELLTEAVEGA